MFAPCDASFSQIAFPIPLDEPVTIATLFFKSLAINYIFISISSF